MRSNVRWGILPEVVLVQVQAVVLIRVRVVILEILVQVPEAVLDQVPVRAAGIGSVVEVRVLAVVLDQDPVVALVLVAVQGGHRLLRE